MNVGAVRIKKMHKAHIALAELTTEGREKTQQDWKGTLGEISRDKETKTSLVPPLSTLESSEYLLLLQLGMQVHSSQKQKVQRGLSRAASSLETFSYME